MKPFRCIVGLRHPVGDVAFAVRDRLSEIAPNLEDVEQIRVVERRDQPDGGLLLVNEWRINPKLPSALSEHISPDMLGWHDHAIWSANASHCRWRIEPFFMPEAIRCVGETRFEPAMGGRGMRATFEGSFDVDPSALARVPAAWRGAASSALELLVGSLIPRNFRKTTDAVVGLLA